MPMPPRPGQRYQPSGRFGISSLLLVPLLGLPVAAVGAAVYAYASVYIPIIGYVTVLLTVGLGFLVGFAVAQGVQRGKARSGPLAAALGLAVGLAALYLSWGFWIYALAQRSDLELSLLGLLLDPAGLWQAIGVVNAEGAWSVKGLTPTGTVLWIFWAIEALLIAGIPAFVGAAQAVSPFCEQCLGWCQEEKGVFLGAAAPREELVRRLQALELSHVAAAGPAQPGAETHLRYDLHRCACGATLTLTVTEVTSKVVDGKPKESTTAVLSNLVVTRDQAAALRKLGQEPPPAQAAAQG